MQSANSFSRGCILDRSAIILASGFSEPFNQVKALLEFNSKPLVKHVADTVEAIVDEVIIVSDNDENAQTYREVVDCAKVVVADFDLQAPLVGAQTGLEVAQGTHSLLVSSDAPLLSAEVVDLLFELCVGKTAAVPRWPNQQIEPLRAIYHTQSALKAAQLSLDDGCTNLESLIDTLGGVRYVSTLAIQEFDPDLKVLYNINTPVDLKMAETLSKPKPWLVRKQRKK
jgi:molybdopterin-guanine dinucleotide biosynthesis protein A